MGLVLLLLVPACIHAAVNDARIVGVAGTEGVTSGAQVTALVTLRNTGTTTWSQAAAYGLAIVDDPYAVLDLPYPRVGFPADVSVAPGAEITLPLALRAPASVLTVSVKLRMVQEFVEFFGETHVLRFEVGPGVPEPLPRAGFSAPFALDPHGLSELMAGPPPRIASDGKGHCIAVWASRHHATIDTGADADIIMARSADGGRTWTDPAPLNTNATINDGQFDREDDQPDIAATGDGQWVAVWRSNGTIWLGSGSNYKILYATSLDDGVTWSAPVRLNYGQGMELTDGYAPKVTCRWNAIWMISWVSVLSDLYSRIVEVHSIRSGDRGQTWSDGGSLRIPCFSAGLQRLASDGHGSWMMVVMADYSLGSRFMTSRQTYQQRDFGTNWTLITQETMQSHADQVDDEGGLISPDQGQWALSSSGKLAGSRISVYWTSRDDAVTWEKKGYSQYPFADPTRPYYLGTTNIIADRNGNTLGIICNSGAYGGVLGSDTDIHAVRLEGPGADRDRLMSVNVNAGFDSGEDAVPECVLNDDGSAVAVWTSTERFGDRLPAGSRILVATAEKLFAQSNAALGWSGYE